METVCTLENIVKKYGPGIVLGPVSLCVGAGEIVGIAGENGAGKSTLINLMAGVLRPDGGHVSWPGDARRHIGWAPQEIALYPTLTGRENLRFWAGAAGLHGRAGALRVNWLLSEMNLTEKADRRVETYSGGMKRRLNLAAALAGTPKLLLLDEPTAGADEPSTAIILRCAEKAARQLSAGVVLVTHRREELEICTRVLTLSRGRLTGAAGETNANGATTANRAADGAKRP